MANELTVTAAQIGRAHPETDEVYTFVAGATIAKGEAVYITTAGKAAVADANGSGTLQFRGIALNAATSGDPVAVIQKGVVTGFDVSSLDCDVVLYLSDTAGDIASTTGSTGVVVGRVWPTSEIDADGNVTLAVYVNWQWEVDWS